MEKPVPTKYAMFKRARGNPLEGIDALQRVSFVMKAGKTYRR
jgi:hypothetical protein